MAVASTRWRANFLFTVAPELTWFGNIQAADQSHRHFETVRIVILLLLRDAYRCCAITLVLVRIKASPLSSTSLTWSLPASTHQFTMFVSRMSPAPDADPRHRHRRGNLDLAQQDKEKGATRDPTDHGLAAKMDKRLSLSLTVRPGSTRLKCGVEAPGRINDVDQALQGRVRACVAAQRGQRSGYACAS